MLWQALFRTPYVLHVQDVWPESVIGSGFMASERGARLARIVLLAWLRRLHRGAAHVLAIAPGAARLLVERGSHPDRTSTVVNLAVHTPSAAERPARGEDGTTTIVYAGNIGPNQGLDAIVHAAARCSDLPGLRFEFVGDGLARQRLRDLADALGATNTTFRPPVSREHMPAVHAGADFEIVALADAPMSPITIPSKLQDAFATASRSSRSSRATLRTSSAGVTLAWSRRPGTSTPSKRRSAQRTPWTPTDVHACPPTHAPSSIATEPPSGDRPHRAGPPEGRRMTDNDVLNRWARPKRVCDVLQRPCSSSSRRP